MDAANRFDRTVDPTSSRTHRSDRTVDHTSSWPLLPFGGHAHASPASPSADDSSDSDDPDPSADDSTTHGSVSLDSVPIPVPDSTHPDHSGIPRACYACGENFPSGNVLFRDHLTDARVCPYATSDELVGTIK